MRSIAFAALLATGFCAVSASTASAGVKVSIKKASYEITGKTGLALIEAMDRRGPKHGLLTRAIAQTKYTVGWEILWSENKGICRVKKADAVLSITYTYPLVRGTIPPELNKRWARFVKGVRKHEETHGRIARQMVVEAERSVAGLAIPNDIGCRRASADAKKRVNAIYARYEKQQMLFDRREHGSGGNVERLIVALAR
jgi:predicted secreted Zn-dependent protease